jgi:hypothetical protein
VVIDELSLLNNSVSSNGRRAYLHIIGKAYGGKYKLPINMTGKVVPHVGVRWVLLLERLVL